MEYPYCGEELLVIDSFGRLASHQDGRVLGDIYTCENEECDMCMENFYTYRDKSDDIHEGYPC